MSDVLMFVLNNIFTSFSAILVILILFVALVQQRKLKARQKKHLSRLLQNRKMRERDYGSAASIYSEMRGKLEKDDTIVLPVIHDLEFNVQIVGKDPAPVQISYEEAFEIVSAIRRAGKRQAIKLVLHTLGGYALPSMMIADAVHRHEGKVTVFVPYVAMSGGTIIALAADVVCMSPIARLGPVDTVFGHHTLNVLRELEALKANDKQGDLTLLLRLEAEKYESFSRREMRIITNSVHKKGGENDHSVADYLSSGELSHQEALSADRARAIGMKIEKRCPDVVYDFTDARIRMIKTNLESELRIETERESDESEARAKSAYPFSPRRIIDSCI